MNASEVSEIMNRVELAGVIDLARQGRYAEAEGLLHGVNQGNGNPFVLDLWARIRAQQGRLTEAEQLWQRAAAADPSNDAYAAALKRLASLQQRSPWSAAVVPLLILMAGGLCLAGAAYGLRRSLHAQSQRVEEQLSTSRMSVTTEIGALTTQIKELRGIVEAAAARNQQASQPATIPAAEAAVVAANSRRLADDSANAKVPASLPAIDVPNVVLAEEGGTMSVAFAAPLFGHRASLKPEAAALLTAVGRELEPHVQRISVEVVGYTDNLPIPAGSNYRSNFALALARAAAVVDHLHATTDLPPAIFSISSGAESSSPYPNDTDENRARNRTAVLRISAAH